MSMPSRGCFPGSLVLFALLGAACGTADYVSDGQREDVCLPVEEDGGGGIDEAPNGAALCPVGACNYQSGEGCEQGQRSEEHTSALQSRENLVCRLLLEKKKVYH